MRDPAAVQAEHAFIDHLADRGVGAARALRGLDGSSLYTYPAPEGDRILTLFEWAPGRVQIGKPKTRSERRQRNKQSRFYGAAVARMHTAADEFPADRLPVIDLRTSVIEGANYLNSFLTSGHDRRRLRKAANAALRMAKQIQSDPFDNGPCHGDDHAGNGTIDGKTVTLYDFDLCGVAPRAFDLATYRWSNEVQSKHEDEGWKNFIAGYRSVRALPDREVMAAQMLLPVRHFWFMQILSNYEGHWNGIASFMNGDRPHKDLDRLDAWTKQVASLDPSFGRELSK
jgi:Ser/Thr protein kinase RdoA (MazF antagonist)